MKLFSTIIIVLVCLLTTGMIYESSAQPSNTTRPDGTTKTTFPTDRNSRGVAVPYFWDSASNTYKPVGASQVIFSRMDTQHITDVSNSAWSTVTLASGFKDAGGVINWTGSGYLMVMFDLGSSATGVAYDTFFVSPGAQAFIPISADTMYVKESATAPELEIQQGKVDY